MYLQRVAVKNFRVFNEQGIEVNFGNGVNAIIGENNCGKSALIDAIRIAFSTVPYSKDIFFTKSDFHTNMKGEQAETAQIDVYLAEVPNFLIEIWNPEEPTTGEFHLRFYKSTAPNGTIKVKYKAWGGKAEGNPLSSETFDAMNIAFLHALRDAEDEMSPSRNSKLANLLSSVTPNEGIKAEIVAELVKANEAILLKEPVKKTKEIINANLGDIEQDLLRQQIDLGFVDPKFESIASSLRSWLVPRWFFIANTYPHYAVLLEKCSVAPLKRFLQNAEDGILFDINGFLQSDTEVDCNITESLIALMKHSFELSQNGLGYNNLLFMSAVLGDMSLGKAGIHLNLFTIEEPEAHLHPQLQQLIHNFFERKHKSSQSIQVIYTTHSPTLVSRIGIGSINLLYQSDYRIKSYPLAKANLDGSVRDYLEKYIDVTKSQMFFAKGIIFVEGISEAILLPEMAKILNRPFDKYSVEVVNIDGTSFTPFAKLLTVQDGTSSFAKAAIITDDDRCTDKNDPTTYISKDLDYDADLNGIYQKLQAGSPSARYENIKALCGGTNIELCGAYKTLEYELACEANNVPYILNSIIGEFPTVGEALKAAVEAEADLHNKALLIWLFIRTRNSSKGQLAQSLIKILQKQVKDIQDGVAIEKPFVIPPYIKKAIFAVTEPGEGA